MPGVFDLAKQAYLAVRRPPTQTTQGQTVRTIRGHISAVAFFKDNRRVLAGTWTGALRILDVQKGAEVGWSWKGHKDRVHSVAVSPDDRRIASAGDDNIVIWDVETRQNVFDPLVKHTKPVYSVCFSPDGKRLASGSWDGTVLIWDAETSAVLATLPHNSDVCSVAFSPDGLKLTSGSLNNFIRVWRTDDAELLLEIAHEDAVGNVVWSPDGQQLISASDNKTIKFWNSSNGEQVGQPCTGHTEDIKSLAMSFDGSFVATASKDKTVRLWNTKTHQHMGPALEHTEGVECVAISPNGKLLVSGHPEWKLHIWSIENIHSAEFGPDPSFFAQRGQVNLEQKCYQEALSDAEKVIEFHPLSCRGYELKHAALHGAQRYGEAIQAFDIMLSKLDNAPDPQIRQLRQQYVSPSEAEEAFRRAIHAKLEDAPLRLISTSTGRLYDRQAQINAFVESTEYNEILYSSMMHAPLQTEPIKEAVAKYFSWVMLSHRWESNEPRLHDIQDKAVYDLDPVGTNVKLQKFCEVARDAGHRWAWSDTCCIDQNNNVELQRSVNSMFIWYRCSALTIVYLSDVPPSSKSGALANSAWNTRGWTVQEFLAPNIVLFYQADWTLYLDDRSLNHKKSSTILQELERSTGIDAQSLIAFRPGMAGAREKLQWASMRVTTWEEDIAYSLFGIFGVHLPVIYGEKKQNALGRLSQEIVAQSGDISALEWVGKSSEFNSCLPADITSYEVPPCISSSLPEDQMQMSVSSLRNGAVVELALRLYTRLDNLNAPRFDHRRLHLPCIAFPVTAVRRRRGQEQETCFTYDVKADGLQDLLISTEDRLVQFSRACPTQQTFLLIRPWNRDDLELPDFVDDTESADVDSGFIPESPSDDSPRAPPTEDGLDDLDSQSRALRLIVRLGQPFGALLLAQKRGVEYKRIASDNHIMAHVKDVAAVHDIMDIRTLEIV